MPNENRAISFWKIGEQFLRLSNVAAKNLVANNNPYLTLTDSIEESEQEMEWSDHNIAIPLLFNFYHGIELMLKGFLAFNEVQCRNHKFSNLIRDFERDLGSNDFLDLVKKHTIKLNKKSFISDFNTENSINIDDWYQSLKYPEMNNDRTIFHSRLQFNGQHALEFWQEIANDSLELIRLSRKFHLDETYKS